MPERRLEPHLSQWVVQALSRLLATYALVQGASIVLGGVERWQSPAFSVALTVPGAPESWGWVLLTFGAVTLTGTFRPWLRTTAVALAAIGAWSLFFAGSFVIYFFTVDGASTTGILTYGFIAVLACTLAVAYGRSR